MSVLVDTSIWSLVLRRQRKQNIEISDKLEKLVHENQVKIIGPVRQEILSGIREESQFKKLQKLLAAFPDIHLLTEDYVLAAQYFNQCRAKGIQGSNTDFLICAVTHRNNLSIFTTDRDFELFAKYLPIKIYH